MWSECRSAGPNVPGVICAAEEEVFHEAGLRPAYVPAGMMNCATSTAEAAVELESNTFPARVRTTSLCDITFAIKLCNCVKMTFKMEQNCWT